MAERLVISFDPGPIEQSQKVQDVFGHVLDLFDLLGHSGSAADEVVGWRLVRVSMNSPLTVEAEAIAIRPVPPDFDIAVVARAQRATFTRHVTELKTGRVPDAWRGPRELQRVRRAFNPSRTAATRVEVPPADDRLDAEHVEILPLDLPAIETALAVAAAESAPRPKRQRGSIEGHLLEVGMYYGKPAIKLLERKSRSEVWCTVTEEHRAEIAREANFDDVWAGRRVMVEGQLLFDEGGSLLRVAADAVHLVQSRDVATDAIHDPNATQGMSTLEYLERFREGSLG